MEEGLVKVDEIISLEQLPVISERLHEVKEKWQGIAEYAESLAVTDDDFKEAKRIRADIRKEFSEIDGAYKRIKKAYMQPWEVLDATYRECVKEPFERSDASLKSKVEEIANGRKIAMEEQLLKYYEEYRQSLGLDSAIAGYLRSGIEIGLSDSMRSLKKRAKEFLDGVDKDLKMIDTLENRDEVYVEYRMSLDVADAVRIVNERHRQAEEARRQRESEEESKKIREQKEAEIDRVIEEQNDVIEAPVVVVVSEEPDEKVFCVAFKVLGTLGMLKELKAFLVDNGYQFENLEV